MKRRNVILIYLLLTIAVLASAVPFAFELREVLYADPEQPDLEKATVPATPTPRPAPTPPPWRQIGPVSGVFTKTRALDPVTTPVPTATRVPKPTDTPKPPPLAQNYYVVFALKDKATLVSYTMETVKVALNQVVDEPLGPFKVTQIDSRKQRVEVELISTGTRRWLEKKKDTKKK